mgnify:CR=1 FL=1
MALIDQTPVMDVSPWPHGRGFAGARSWWEYVISKEERQRLDNLMGIALLDEDVCERLVNERDDSLLSAFGLSEKTRNWLRAIQANSLDELAQAIVSGQ